MNRVIILILLRYIRAFTDHLAQIAPVHEGKRFMWNTDVSVAVHESPFRDKDGPGRCAAGVSFCDCVVCRVRKFIIL